MCFSNNWLDPENLYLTLKEKTAQNSDMQDSVSQIEKSAKTLRWTSEPLAGAVFYLTESLSGCAFSRDNRGAGIAAPIGLHISIPFASKK